VSPGLLGGGGGVASDERGQDKRLMAFAAGSNYTFACSLYNNVYGSGTLMEFKPQKTGVGRGSIVKGGKDSVAAATKTVILWGQFTPTDGSGCHHHTSITVPNTVATIRLKKRVNRSIKRHWKSNDNREKFSGISINLDVSRRCTPGLHVGKGGKPSSAVLPGTRTIKELVACINEVDELTREFIDDGDQ
jgi:hypothetical protein